MLCLISSAAGFTAEEMVPLDWQQKSYAERGKYIVDHLGNCIGCHTPIQKNGVSNMQLYLSGVPAKFAGTIKGPPQVAGFPRPKGARVYTSNLTPDPETGLGKWSEKDFIQAFKKGVRPDGVKYVESPMEWDQYSNMKIEDIQAIYRYLRTVKPIENNVPKNIPPK
jgi:mono/diheme cytochrome c family protein